MTYRPPTGLELRALLRAWGLTGGSAGALIGVNSRTVRRWTGDDMAMPYAALFCLAAKMTGRFISLEGWREELIE